MSASTGKPSIGPKRYAAWNGGSRGAAFVLGSVLAAALLWGAEAGLVWLHPDPYLVALDAAREAGREVDLRSRAEVVAALQHRGLAAVPRVVPATLLVQGADDRLHSRLEPDVGNGSVSGSPSAFLPEKELLPLSGVGSRHTVLCAEAGPFASFDSDPHGFRNPPDLWTRAPIELLLVGDSFALGECVEDGDTIADRLRREWPVTVNVGYSGHSPLLELASLVEYGPALRPKTTLWLYFENDLSWFDLARSASSPLLMRYLEPDFSQRLIERRSEIDARLTALLDREFDPVEGPPAVEPVSSLRDTRLDTIRSLLALQHLRIVLGRARPRLPINADPASIELLGEILTRAAAVSATWGGEVVFVYLPGVWRYDRFVGIPTWTGPHVREAIRRRVLEIGLEFVDVEEAIAQHPAPLSLFAYPGQSDRVGAPHMNAAGYAISAEVVGAALRDRVAASQASVPGGADSSLRSQTSRQ